MLMRGPCMFPDRQVPSHAEVLPTAESLVRASVAPCAQNLSIAQSLLSKYIGGHACSSWQRSLQQHLWLQPMLPLWMRMWLEESLTLRVSSHRVHTCSHASLALGVYDEGHCPQAPTLTPLHGAQNTCSPFERHLQACVSAR